MVRRPAAALLVLLALPGAAEAAQTAWERCSHGQGLRRVVESCTEVLRTEKDRRRRAQALANRGNAYVETSLGHDPDKALADLDAAVALDPSSSFALRSRADVYVEKGDTERAFADFAAALRLAPADVDLLSARALAYQNRQDWDRAIADYTAILRLKPDDRDALQLRAVAALQKGDFDRAAADYSEVIRLDPGKDAASVRWNRGNAYLHGGQFDRAIADFSEAIRLNPGDRLAYGSRAEAYERKGELRKALADAEVDLRFNPDSALVRANRDRVHAALAAAEDAGGPPAGETLDEARATDFFTYFHLEPSCAPLPAGNGAAWHCFRPPASGLFNAVAEVDVLVERNGRVSAARLGLDRAFVRHSVNGAFARDIAKSFLAWAVPDAEHSAAVPLMAAIARSAPEGTVKLQANPLPPAPADTTGGFETFLGQRPTVAFTAERAEVALANFAGSLPGGVLSDGAPAGPDAEPQWLRLEVRRKR